MSRNHESSIGNSTTSTRPPQRSAASTPAPGGAIIVTGSNAAIVRATSAWASFAAAISAPG
ncbi:MAG: hypothetical protein QM733_00455 [Ilumatobacteraceae bacterium]